MKLKDLQSIVSALEKIKSYVTFGNEDLNDKYIEEAVAESNRLISLLKNSEIEI